MYGSVLVPEPVIVTLGERFMTGLIAKVLALDILPTREPSEFTLKIVEPLAP